MFSHPWHTRKRGECWHTSSRDSTYIGEDVAGAAQASSAADAAGAAGDGAEEVAFATPAPEGSEAPMAWRSQGRGSYGMEVPEEQAPETWISKAQAKKGTLSMEERGPSSSSTMDEE